MECAGMFVLMPRTEMAASGRWRTLVTRSYRPIASSQELAWLVGLVRHAGYFLGLSFFFGSWTVGSGVMSLSRESPAIDAL